jgi:phosphohistidine phosphatase
MDLFFLRHGIAEDASDSGADADRRLTTEGRQRCAEAAAGLARLAGGVTHVWTSPLVRARETAELMLPDQAAEVRPVLADAPVEHLLTELGRLPAEAVVVLVGHEPQLSAAVETLLDARAGLIEMKKAGVAQVTVDFRHWPQRPAVLKALLPPAVLRRVG